MSVLSRSVIASSVVLAIAISSSSIASAQIVDHEHLRSPDVDDANLRALETASHQQWLERDIDALSQIMDDDFHLVVMNGAVESRVDVLGDEEAGRAPLPSPLVVRSISIDPEEVYVRTDTGIVISTMHIDASVRDRALPPQMRVMSVFSYNGEDWTLLARSITPIQQRAAEQ
jgi:uncharacterized protein DUF4440